MGGLVGFWAKASTGAMNRRRKETGAMNREAKIVCCGCYHSLDPRSYVLRKRAPFCNRCGPTHIVENSGVFAGVNGLNACGRMGKEFLVVMGVFEEVRSVLIDGSSYSMFGQALGR